MTTTNRAAATRRLGAFALLWVVSLPCAAAQLGIFVMDDDVGAIHLTDRAMGPSTRLLVSVAGFTRDVALPPRAPPSRSSVSPVMRAASMPSGRDILPAVDRASRQHGVPAALLLAVIDTESGYAPRAVSPRGALGLMQLMPDTARSYGVVDAFDVGQNIDAGARHLRHLLDRFGSDTRLALAAYNAGAGAVSRHGNRIPPFAETMAYVPLVLDRFARLQTSLYGSPAALATLTSQSSWRVQ